MARSVRSTSKPNPEPLGARDAKGNIIGLSYDGGKTWSTRAVPPANEPYKAYTRHIAAIMGDQGMTPTFQRRISNAFAPLKDADMLTAWGSIENILAYDAKTIGAIVIPVTELEIPAQDVPDLIATLRTKAPKIMVDMGDRPIHNPDHLAMAIALAEQADALLVASDRIGMTLRKHNANTFTVPSTIDPAHWKDFKRFPHPGTLRVAVQPHDNRFIDEGLTYVADRYPAYKIEIIEDRWFERLPAQDAQFYGEIDVVLIGAPGNPTYAGNTPLLGPLAAGCAVVADAVYNKTIIHGHSGVLIAKPGPGMWRQELTHIVTDRGYRLKMQKGGRERSRLYQNRVNLSRLALPYRVLVPAQELKIG